MKNETINALLEIIDSSFETQIKNINRFYAGNLSNNLRDYPNYIINSSLLYEEYYIIRKRLLKRAQEYSSFRIVDFGCGVGNVLVTLKEIMKSDKTLFKALKSSEAIGIEKFSPYAHACIDNLNNNVEVHCLNMRHTTSFKESMKDIKNKPKVDLNIWYCNRPFRDLEEEFRLEKFLLDQAPIGTFLINPMGLTIYPTKGVKVINKHIYEKIGCVKF